MEWLLPKAVKYSNSCHKEAAEVEHCSQMIHPNFRHSQTVYSFNPDEFGPFRIDMRSIQLMQFFSDNGLLRKSKGIWPFHVADMLPVCALVHILFFQ